MQITLINCNVRLLALGIDMQAIGSGNLMNDVVSAKLPNYQSWGYDYITDTVTITVPDDSVIPDMSDLGEVVPNDSPIG